MVHQIDSGNIKQKSKYPIYNMSRLWKYPNLKLKSNYQKCIYTVFTKCDIDIVKCVKITHR